MPGAADMLHEIGLSDMARQIFEDELKQSVAPYYYMAYLASLEQDLGHIEAALTWSRQAWQQSHGPATRTQWGIRHLGRLLELSPSAEEEIIQVLQAVFSTLKQHPGSFYQRSRVRLQRLLPVMEQWADSPQRKRVLQQSEQSIAEVCTALEPQSASAQICQQWLELSQGV